MRILIVSGGLIPATKYGGTQRVVSSLVVGLSNLGHTVSLLAPAGSHNARCKEVLTLDPKVPVNQQFDPQAYDVVHFHIMPNCTIKIPYIITIHGNELLGLKGNFDPNIVFVSKNHASRHHSTRYVLNGLDWSEYPSVDLGQKRNGLHFLGKAAWRVKNVRGAIRIARSVGKKLTVLGGYRLNLKMGFRFTPWPSIRFLGMVGDSAKTRVMSRSEGLLFPVMWDEPFGLALIESLYHGCPVFASNRGAIPEVITPEYGVLSNDEKTLAEAIKTSIGRFNPEQLQRYALQQFSAKRMAEDYLKYYSEAVENRPAL